MLTWRAICEQIKMSFRLNVRTIIVLIVKIPCLCKITFVKEFQTAVYSIADKPKNALPNKTKILIQKNKEKL